MLKKKNIMGIGFTDVDFEIILEYVIKKLREDNKKFYIVTPNPEIIILSKKDLGYKNVLNQAEIALPDGVGILFAGQILGQRLKRRITGVDFMEMLCERLSKQPITVGFLGGTRHIADDASECLVAKYPDLQVSFVGTEPPRDLSDIECDMLFVAFGSPKQEKWIAENLNKLSVKAAMGVGGAFDIISGRIPRSPLFLRKIGLEWLFRLIRQPWRIKRQIRLAVFLLLVLRERFKYSLN